MTAAASVFGHRMWFAWVLRRHSGQREDPIDLSDPETWVASRGLLSILETAADLRLRGLA